MTHDTPLKIGHDAPEFLLRDLDGHPHALSHYRGRIVLLNFWSAECEWSQRADEAIKGWMADWGSMVEWISIAPNANESPEEIRAEAGKRELPLVLHDPDRAVTGAYGAEMTPEFFLVDAEGFLRYKGALNDITFRQTEPTRHYLKEAVDALLNGETPDPAETDAYGCTIVFYS